MNFRPVPVWSRVQRIIHWVNAFCVLLLIPIGVLIYSADYLKIPDEGVDTVMDIHVAIGFVFLAGAASRIIYLFTGPRESRWRDVVPHTRRQWSQVSATLRYYLSRFRGRAPLYFSHNALAGIFDALLFAVFITQASSGVSMFILHGTEHAGNNASHAQVRTARPEDGPPGWILDLHDAGAAFIAVFVLSHFTALGVHDVAEDRGLVSSMISGNKFFNDEELEELGPEISKNQKRP